MHSSFVVENMPPKRKASSSAVYLEALYTNKNFKWPKPNGLETLWEESSQLPTQKRKRVIAQQPVKRLIDFDKDTVTKRKQKKQARVKKVKAVKGWMPQRKSKSNKNIEEKLNALLDSTDLVKSTGDVSSLKNACLRTASNVLISDDMNNHNSQDGHFDDINHAANENMSYSCSGDSGEANYAQKTLLLHMNACHGTNTISTYGSETNNLPLLRHADSSSNFDTKLSGSCLQQCEDMHLVSIPTKNDFGGKTENKLLCASSESIAISWSSETQAKRLIFCDDNIVDDDDIVCDDLHSEIACKLSNLNDEKNVEKENTFNFNAKDTDHYHGSTNQNLSSPDKLIASNFACVSVFDHSSERGGCELDEYDKNANGDMIQPVTFIEEDIDNVISTVTQVYKKNKSEKKRKRRRDSTAAFSSLAQKLSQAESAFSPSVKDN